jgi:hypothetical protein
MREHQQHRVSNRVLIASNLISLFLKDKLVAELLEIDTTIGEIEVTYEVKESSSVLFTANIEMFDEDIEDYLPYQSQWFLDVVQVLEWPYNQEKFENDYRVKQY